MPKSRPIADVVDDWNSYWLGSQAASAEECGGVKHPLVSSFWAAFFREQQGSSLNTLDVAAGSGAIVAAAQGAGLNLGDFVCLDTSTAAITTLVERFPDVKGLVADALSIPLAKHSLDVTTSQFGVEYAGMDAINELIRVLVPGGRMGLLLHCQDSVIYREAAASVDAIARLQASRFIPMALEMFEAGFAIFQGVAPQRYRHAAKEFKPVYHSLEAIMDQHGVHVAGDTVCELYNSVARIQNRLQHHDGREVLDWLTRIDSELTAYSGRMDSMCDVALSKDNFDLLCDQLHDKQFEIQQAGRLQTPGQTDPVAWFLVANKK